MYKQPDLTTADLSPCVYHTVYNPVTKSQRKGHDNKRKLHQLAQSALPVLAPHTILSSYLFVGMVFPVDGNFIGTRTDHCLLKLTMVRVWAGLQRRL